ncbi:MAG: DUF2889 domain-containing protein [Desulfobacterales bacterium]|nr:DUF2889 domain-containing protein [Desulfobacterales bacterium]
MSMPHILSYSRNRCTTVEQIDEETIRSTCSLQDTLTDGRVEITVKLPDLEITSASGGFSRTWQKACRHTDEALQKVIGVRVGPGMLKIIPGLIEEVTDCGQLTFMVEECCHGVILAFTKETLQKTPGQMEGSVKFYQDLVKKNVRLYNRCAAFAKGSVLVEGVEPPEPR